MHEIHKSALPLLRRINDGTLTRADVSAHFGFPVNVSNWLVRGISAKRLPEVAAACGLTTEEYLAEAGMAGDLALSRDLIAPDTPIAHDFNQLPPDLQRYLADKISDTVRNYKAIPKGMRLEPAPPRNSPQYAQWAANVEGLLAHMATFNIAAQRRARRAEDLQVEIT